MFEKILKWIHVCIHEWVYTGSYEVFSRGKIYRVHNMICNRCHKRIRKVREE